MGNINRMEIIFTFLLNFDVLISYEKDKFTIVNKSKVSNLGMNMHLLISDTLPKVFTATLVIRVRL